MSQEVTRSTEGNYLTVQCEDALEFFVEISPHSERFVSSYPRTWAFRGQSDAWWGLIPSAFRNELVWFDLDGRRHVIQSKERWNYHQISHEVRLLRSFFDFANESALSLPEEGQRLREVLNKVWPLAFADWEGLDWIWPPREIWSLLAIAQHHGIPTRLLDFSWSPYIAAYFASISIAGNEEKKDQAIAVWAYAESGHTMLPDAIKEKGEQIRIIESPYAGNKNLAAQQGLHLLFVPESNQWRELVDPLVVQSHLEMIHTAHKGRVNDFDALIKFTLPASQTRELLFLLAKEGIHSAFLFPGFDGAAKAVHEEKLWKQYQ